MLTKRASLQQRKKRKADVLIVIAEILDEEDDNELLVPKLGAQHVNAQQNLGMRELSKVQYGGQTN